MTGRTQPAVPRSRRSRGAGAAVQTTAPARAAAGQATGGRHRRRVHRGPAAASLGRAHQPPQGGRRWRRATDRANRRGRRTSRRVPGPCRHLASLRRQTGRRRPDAGGPRVRPGHPGRGRPAPERPGPSRRRNPGAPRFAGRVQSASRCCPLLAVTAVVLVATAVRPARARRRRREPAEQPAERSAEHTPGPPVPAWRRAVRRPAGRGRAAGPPTAEPEFNAECAFRNKRLEIDMRHGRHLPLPRPTRRTDRLRPAARRLSHRRPDVRRHLVPARHAREWQGLRLPVEGLPEGTRARPPPRRREDRRLRDASRSRRSSPATRTPIGLVVAGGEIRLYRRRDSSSAGPATRSTRTDGSRSASRCPGHRHRPDRLQQHRGPAP